jgi:serine/threonine protein kinase
MQLGQYLLEAKIGEGGMGTVYRASHAMLRRPTAIKLMSTANAVSLARFEREVQLTASLRHPNTIAIFDYGRTPDGVFYYAMEYLDGVTLDDLVREDGAQSPARVVHILLQVCGSLAEAHAHGLVHRDIKPANLMLSERLDEQDVMKVLDFGLVKDTTPSAMASSANAILGTPYFMAPEAILTPEEVDGRTDIYALGATAYYLLCGRHVFEGSNVVEVCSAHLHEPPIPLANRNPRIPQSLDEVILRCLAKKPEDRPQTARELAGLLSACDVPAWARADAAGAWERLGRQKTQVQPDDKATATVTVTLGDRQS